MNRPPRPPVKSTGLTLGLIGFVGIMAAVPVLLHQRHMRLQNGVGLWAKQEPLTAGQVRRGAYLNTGSVDAGPDPDWDHKSGTYKGRRPQIVDADRPDRSR